MASRADDKAQARDRRLAAEEADRRAARRRSSLMRLGLVLGLAVVAVIVAIVLSSRGGPSDSGSGSGTHAGDAAAAKALFRGIPQKGLNLGANAKAPVLVEFADLQCPYCGLYSNGVLPTVVKDYVRPGRVRYQLHIRSFLGPDSVRAAGAAAVATKENRLYQFADLFYRRQREENTGYATDDFIRAVASGTGVDAAKAASAADDAKSQPLVAQAEQRATAVGSHSTPDFFLRLKSGRLVHLELKALTPPAMREALDQALAQQT
jgi:protein-disulfide isomerase